MRLGTLLKIFCRMLRSTFRFKGGLFAWETLRHCSSVTPGRRSVDLAVLWQAGFRNTTCAIGTHLTPPQLAQLGDQPSRCYVQLAPQDVWREYARAVAKRTRLALPEVS